MPNNLEKTLKKYTKWQYIYFALFILYCLYVYLSGSPINILWFIIMGTIIIHVLTKNRYLEILSRFLLYLFIILNIIWFVQGLSFYSQAYSSQPDVSIYNNHFSLFLIRNGLFFIMLILALAVNKPINRFRFKDLISKMKKKSKLENEKTL